VECAVIVKIYDKDENFLAITQTALLGQQQICGVFFAGGADYNAEWL